MIPNETRKRLEEEAEKYAAEMYRESMARSQWSKSDFLSGAEIGYELGRKEGLREAAEIARNYTDVVPTTWKIADAILALASDAGERG